MIPFVQIGWYNDIQEKVCWKPIYNQRSSMVSLPIHQHMRGDIK